MEPLLPAYESALRLAAFAAVLGAMALWEVLAPRRARTLSRRRRWPANLGIVVLNTLVVRALFPAAAVGIALSAQTHGWGLLNQYAVPASAALVAGILLIDLAIYSMPFLPCGGCTACTTPTSTST